MSTRERTGAFATAAHKRKDDESDSTGFENILPEVGSSLRLHASRCSSVSSESDLSLSFSTDRELDTYTSRIIDDELPAFEIRLISPLGRTPSPIDINCTEEIETPTKNCFSNGDLTPSPFHNSEFVALQEINAQISPPNDNEEMVTGSSSLETIFEGVFLNTPSRSRSTRTRSNLFEKVMSSRINVGKENHSPLTRRSASSPSSATIAQVQSMSSDKVHFPPSNTYDDSL